MSSASKTIGSWLTIGVFFLALTGCSLYRPDLSQGNLITQDKLAELQPNLTKHQVQQIIGSTALSPVFETDEWNYNFAYVDGKHRDQPLKYKTLTLYFSHDKLQSYSSNYWKAPHLPVHK